MATESLTDAIPPRGNWLTRMFRALWYTEIRPAARVGGIPTHFDPPCENMRHGPFFLDAAEEVHCKRCGANLTN